jgi:hypothetical protein
MESLTFDTLIQAWNMLRTRNLQGVLARVPMLQNPRALLMKRVTETPFMLTVMFRGFDQALSDTESGTPLMKRFLLDWIRNFGQAQIERGADENSMIIRITKPSLNPLPQPAVESAPPKRTGPLAHIAQVRKLDGY